MRKNSILRVLFIVSLVIVRFAYSDASEPEPRADEVLQFEILLATNGTKTLYYRDHRGEFQIRPPSRTRSNTRHQYRNKSPILFYEKITDPEGKLIERVVAEVEFEKKQEEILIILHPFDQEWSRCRAIVLDDSKKAFPGDHLKALNISVYDVQVLINGESIGLQPKDEKSIKIKASLGYVNWRIAAKLKDQWQLVRAASTQFLEGMRQIIIVNVDVSNKTKPRLDIFTLYDRVRAN